MAARDGETMRRSQRVWNIESEPGSNEKIFEMLRPGAAPLPRPAQDPLSLLFRRSMLWKPERYARSAWVEHVPFAFWLVDVLRPRVIVELGTHSGVSYSAMCQAVKCLGLATSCFAVDTWRGDEHSGFYAEDIYSEFAAFHDRHYSAFSRLVRSTFDDALLHFDNGTIDLLHIDGLHTYDAVQHDYQTWLPKLSPNAIVLLHDTNVREGDFAVHRLWGEIGTERLHFEFLHGHGLGVLASGADYADPLNLLLEADGNESLTADIRSMFSELGRFTQDVTKFNLLREALARNAEAHASAVNLAMRIVCGPPRRILAGLRMAKDYLLKHDPAAERRPHRD
jgi:hypothetical protein